MKKYIILAAVLFCSASALFAQTRVSGVVTDAEGNPLPGTTVIVKGTAVGTVADGTGRYQLNFPAGSRRELDVNMMGYEKKTVPVPEGVSTMDITLQSESTEIETVVVTVGYGSMRKSDITGSVTSVRIDENYVSQVTSLDQLLKGRAAGVQVTAATAAPGAEVNIQIRGYSSFSGGGEPLYVVDGVMLNSAYTEDDMFTQGGTKNSGSQEGTNGLMGISPQDIASIEILKDASATAIYGSMGANGVVLITTKMGSLGKPVVTWSSSVDIAQPRKLLPVLEFDDYVKYLQRRGDRRSELAQIFEDPDNPDVGLLNYIQPMNWQKYALRNAVSQRHRIGVSGGTESTNYNIAASYDKVEGLMLQTGTETASLRINIDQRISRHVKIGTRSNFSRVRLNMTQSKDNSNNTTEASIMRSILNKRPWVNIDKLNMSQQEGGDDLDESSRSSPIAWFDDFADNTLQYRITPNFFLEAELFPWLTYRFEVGGDYNARERSKWKGPQIVGDGDQSVAARSNTRSLRYNMDNMLMFNHKFGEHHRLSGTLGTTFTRSMQRVQTVEGWNIPQTAPQDRGVNGAPNSRFAYKEKESAILSFLARAVYSYKDRYILTATFRADGSSKFKKDNRYKYFPSVALAWRIAEENWFNVPAIDNLKLRAGWGRVGNEGSLPPYLSRANLEITSRTKYPVHDPANPSEYLQGIVPTNMPNPSLKWETTESYNIGLDLGLLNSRITLAVDAYHKRTWDLLQEYDIPQQTGFPSMWANSGVIQNRGVELALDAMIIDRKDFSWTLGGNISINRNKIVDIGTKRIDYYPGARYDSNGNPMTPIPAFPGRQIGSGQYCTVPGNIFIEGYPMGLFYGIKTNGLVGADGKGPKYAKDGFAPQPGGILYVLQNPNYQPVDPSLPPDMRVDANGHPMDGYRDYVVPEYDQVIIGNPHPKFTYGFGTSFTYKDLMLSATFTGSYGNDIINTNALIDYDITRLGNVRREAFLDAWSPDNPNGKYPAFGAVNPNEKKMFTDRIVEDGSYLRLSNLTLSYSVPVQKVKFIQSLSVSLSVNNVHVWTKYTGWDPEVSSYGSDMKRMGIDSGSYPSARTYSIGVSATF